MMVNNILTTSLKVQLLIFLSLSNSFALGDLTKQEPIEVRIQLGDKTGTLKFFPSTLELETGKLYRMTLINYSPEKHYFSSDVFSQSAFRRKVQVNSADGKPIAEIKGNIREIEVYPGNKVEWWFVPVKAGEIKDLKCTIPGHAAAGMVGAITIK